MNDPEVIRSTSRRYSGRCNYDVHVVLLFTWSCWNSSSQEASTGAALLDRFSSGGHNNHNHWR